MQSRGWGTAVVLAVALPGCARVPHAPSVPIFGSYFPAWVICAVAGIIIAVMIRALFILLHIDQNLPTPPLVYLCLSISAGIGCWLVWTGYF
ncbi:YtcA family lipoprotein [Devosia sp. 1566]|uniref:YtcA family lipoprotein n=1 Tax=Devosia sp. 1566 TaxID=2499144 RepID=UPI000FD930F5|nr:YtcA family lipoprotein [Devosia sp. 1566]